jgi:hypothetical protein
MKSRTTTITIMLWAVLLVTLLAVVGIAGAAHAHDISWIGQQISQQQHWYHGVAAIQLLSGYLTEDECAKQLGVSRRTLQRWRRLRIGPALTKMGIRPMYRTDAVREWLLAQEQPQGREEPRAKAGPVDRRKAAHIRRERVKRRQAEGANTQADAS